MFAFNDVQKYVGRTERSEFRQLAVKPDLTLFGPAYKDIDCCCVCSHS